MHKSHFLGLKSDGIVRTTAKAVVLRMVAPRVYYLLHNNYLIKFMNWDSTQTIAIRLKIILFISVYFSSVITYYLITNKYLHKSTKKDVKRVSLQ